MQNKKSTGNISLSSLVAVLVSVIVAIVILVVFILPAEFGKDITGLGEKLGVSNMSVAESEPTTSNTVVNRSSANIVDNSNNPNRVESPEHAMFATPLQFMQTEIVLAGDGQVEFKFDLATGNEVSYSWSVADGKLAYSDLHGHNPGPTDAEEDDELVRYLDSQQDNSISGHFVAPLTGDHGWYFLNLQSEEIRITIQASGHWDGYELLPLDNY